MSPKVLATKRQNGKKIMQTPFFYLTFYFSFFFPFSTVISLQIRTTKTHGLCNLELWASLFYAFIQLFPSLSPCLLLVLAHQGVFRQLVMNFADAKAVLILEITYKKNLVYWISVIGGFLLKKFHNSVSKLYQNWYIFYWF